MLNHSWNLVSEYFQSSKHFLLLFENLIIWLAFEFEIEFGLDQDEVYKINHDDKAPFMCGYCSLTTRALQFSSTTRNPVPRFKRCSKGEWSGYEILTNLVGLGCYSQRGRSITLTSSFFCFRSPWWSHHLSSEFHRTYKRIKGGHSRRTDLCKVDYLVDNIGEGVGK